MRRLIFLFAVIFIFLILIPVSVNKYYNYELEAVSADGKTQIFVIRPGEPTAQIAQKLKTKRTQMHDHLLLIVLSTGT